MSNSSAMTGSFTQHGVNNNMRPRMIRIPGHKANHTLRNMIVAGAKFMAHAPELYKPEISFFPNAGMKVGDRVKIKDGTGETMKGKVTMVDDLGRVTAAVVL